MQLSVPSETTGLTHGAAPCAAPNNENVCAFVGREPIFDRDLKIHGYRLILPSGDPVEDRDHAAFVVNLLTDVGLDRLVGSHLAFISCTRTFLLSNAIKLLPKSAVVLEISNDVEIDDTLVEELDWLHQQGYRFSLTGSCQTLTPDALVYLADYITLDRSDLTEDEVKFQLTAAASAEIAPMAGAVGKQSEFEALHMAGFAYFRGDFFAKPDLVTQRKMPTNVTHAKQLFARLFDPETDIDEIQQLVANDVGLSYKTLRFINSASFALPQKVDCVQKAVVYFGLERLRQLTALIVFAGIEDKPSELFRVSLIRARFCELLAKAVGGRSPDPYFSVGLLSTLDALLDTSMSDVVGQLPLSTDIVAALLNHEGQLGEALKCAHAYEQCRWAEVLFESLGEAEIVKNYLDALDWSAQAGTSLDAG